MTNHPGATEHSEAVALFEYVRLNEMRTPELRLFHAIPNGAKCSYGKTRSGKRYSRAAGQLQAEGLRRGVPDYYLPYPNKAAFHGLYIELKARDYMPSIEQVFFLIYTRALGYRSTCCWTTDTAIRILDDYLAGQDLVENRIFYNVPDKNVCKVRDLIIEAAEYFDLPDAYYKNVTLIAE